MQTQKPYLIIHSPQDLVKKARLWEKEGDSFYMNARGTAYSFGIPLWAFAYEQCQKLWKNPCEGISENFPFVLNVENCPGFVLSGLELGIKFFLFQGHEKAFQNLQAIVREKKADIWQ